MKKQIFTFWESKDNMPPYIQMCIESWHKVLPDYEIIILNYENLDRYIGKNFYDHSLYENFSLAQQAQAIRAAVLERNGGLWFDADIILTSREFLNYFNDKSELNIFSNRIACMYAQKGSRILKKWINGIKWNIWVYKYLFDFMFEYFPFTASDMMNWDYLSDKILNKLYKCKNKKILNNIDIAKSCSYLELCWVKENRKFKDYLPVDLYNHFYIKNNFYEYVKNQNKGLIVLHNSWMPREYQTLDKKSLLEKGNTLSEILKTI